MEGLFRVVRGFCEHPTNQPPTNRGMELLPRREPELMPAAT
jgi:hypothetical protein